jgi:microtubule-associated protein-like 6
MIRRFKLPKGSRGISAAAFSPQGTFIALADRSDQNNVHVYNTENGEKVFSETTGGEKVMHIVFDLNSDNFVTVGPKLVTFWSVEEKKGQKGLFESKGEMTSFTSAAYDDKGTCYTGGTNGELYVWPSRELERTVSTHKGSFVSAVTWYNGKIYCGGKDG